MIMQAKISYMFNIYCVERENKKLLVVGKPGFHTCWPELSLLIGFLIGLRSPLLRSFCCIVQFCGTIVSPHQPNASFIFS